MSTQESNSESSDEDDFSSTEIDPRFARNLLAFTARNRQDAKKKSPLPHTMTLEDHASGGDRQGFLSKRVVLGGFPPDKADLNGLEGTVTGRHHLAKTYLVALEGSHREVHVPATNMFILFNVDPFVAEVGGAYDTDTGDGGAMKQRSKKKRGPALGERVDGEDNVRLDNCHDFAWSSVLWAEAADHTGKLSLALFVVWLLLGWGLLGQDQGLNGLDSFYLLAATLTTVGIGDLYPASESARIASIFLIPMGLVVLSMVYSFTLSLTFSRPVVLRKERDPLTERTLWQWMRETIPGQCFVIFAKFLSVILFGAFVFWGEDRGDGKENYEGHTFCDAVFFAVVIATTVGYGHELWPLSDSGKGFLIFYFFFSTFVVGGLVGDIVNIYLNGVLAEHINSTIIDSSTWVHRADIDGDGKISEADYVLFKLQQMQRVDTGVLDTLIDKFHELDESGEGLLDIGVEVPSAADVEEMQKVKAVTGSDKSLVDMWKDLRAKRGGPRKKRVRSPETSTRVNACHDFAWSRELWAEAARHSSKVSAAMACVYLALAFSLLGGIEGMRFVDSFYFIVATITTVGFGDFAPEMQVTRGFAIVLIPFGLVTLSFVVSSFTAFGNVATPGHLSARMEFNKTKHGSVVVLQAAFRGNQARKQHSDAVALVHNIHNYKDGKQKALPSPSGGGGGGGRRSSSNSKKERRKQLRRERRKNPVLARVREFSRSLLGRLLLMLARITVVFLCGALFFKRFPPEVRKGLKLSWGEAFYLAVETATTVGYGDITMQTDGGKVYMTFYMLVTTVVTAEALSDLVDLYVNGVLGENINNAIIDSTTWVHRADLDGDGKITEADYVLFKLRQMQRVDKQVMRDLSVRFRKLDESGEGVLDVGVELPSAEHVSEMQRYQRKAKSSKTLVEIWNDVQARARDRTQPLDEELGWVLRDVTKRAREVAKQKRSLQMVLADDDPGLGGGAGKAGAAQGEGKEMVRLNKCHTFDWSRELWGEVSKKLAKASLVGMALYALLGYFLLGYNNGITGVDCWYMLAATVTTVGIGDFYPSKQGTRAAGIFLLPAGLILVGTGMSLAMSYALSQAPALESDERAANAKQAELEAAEDELEERGAWVEVALRKGRRALATAEKWRHGTVAGKVFTVVFKFVAVVLFGALVFYGDEGKYFWDADKTDAKDPKQEFVGRTFVDALYFAVVVATTIGYGHRLWPLTAGAKAFCIFYFFVSTVVVAQLVQDVVDLYVNDFVGERIVAKLIDSTTFVHKADTDGDGRISEADYVLFKLQQLLKVDAEVYDRLVDRYLALDKSKDGFLDVGVEIPNAAQVKEMQRILELRNSAKSKKKAKRVSDLWREVQAKLAYDASHPESAVMMHGTMTHGGLYGGGTHEDEEQHRGGGKGGARRGSWKGEGSGPRLDPSMVGIYKRVASKAAQLKRKSAALSANATARAKVQMTHDFKWSRQLWSEAANEVGGVALSLLFVYVLVAYYALCWPEGWRGVDPFYFLAATLTTVGFGDFAPTRQRTRAAAVFLLPAGLVVFSMLLALVQARANANAPKCVRNRDETEKTWAVTALQSAYRGHMSRKELEEGRPEYAHRRRLSRGGSDSFPRALSTSTSFAHAISGGGGGGGGRSGGGGGGRREKGVHGGAPPGPIADDLEDDEVGFDGDGEAGTGAGSKPAPERAVEMTEAKSGSRRDSVRVKYKQRRSLLDSAGLGHWDDDPYDDMNDEEDMDDDGGGGRGADEAKEFKGDGVKDKVASSTTQPSSGNNHPNTKPKEKLVMTKAEAAQAARDKRAAYVRERNVLREKAKKFKEGQRQAAAKGAGGRKGAGSASASSSLSRRSNNMSGQGEEEGLVAAFRKFLGTLPGKACTLLFKFSMVVVVGAIILMACREPNSGLTWTDAFYFAVETSTTVGYGDITVTTRTGKGLMIVYTVVSTVVVGQILGGIISLYVEEYEGERINSILIDSTTWVHKADTDKDGRVNEAGYLLFKLQQMQKVDEEMLDRLIDRFRALDKDGNHYVSVGVEVPSRFQVAAMEAYRQELMDLADEADSDEEEEDEEDNEEEDEERGGPSSPRSQSARPSSSSFSASGRRRRRPRVRTLVELWARVRRKLEDDSKPLEAGLMGVWRDARAKMAEEANRCLVEAAAAAKAKQGALLGSAGGVRKAPLKVGDRVEVRDGNEPFEAGVVESVAVDPSGHRNFTVRKDGWDASFVWDDMRREGETWLYNDEEALLSFDDPRELNLNSLGTPKKTPAGAPGKSFGASPPPRQQQQQQQQLSPFRHRSSRNNGCGTTIPGASSGGATNNGGGSQQQHQPTPHGAGTVRSSVRSSVSSLLSEQSSMDELDDFDIKDERLAEHYRVLHDDRLLQHYRTASTTSPASSNNASGGGGSGPVSPTRGCGSGGGGGTSGGVGGAKPGGGGGSGGGYASEANKAQAADAVSNYALAAERGNTTAQNILGAMYAEGNSCEWNPSEAVRLFRLAADSGDARGQTNLGNCYARGYGVQQNDAKARRLFELAAAQGHEPARKLLSALQASSPSPSPSSRAVAARSPRVDSAARRKPAAISPGSPPRRQKKKPPAPADFEGDYV